MTVQATGADVASHFRNGLAALRIEEWSIAVIELETCTDLDPAHAASHAYLSGALLALGRPDDAAAAVDRALELDPDGFSPNLKAGELAVRLGDLDRAERRFLAALRSAEPGSPDAAAARRWLAITRERQRRSIRRQAVLPHVRPRARLGLPGLPRSLRGGRQVGAPTTTTGPDDQGRPHG